MSDPLLPLGDGHTELTEDDRVGPIPSYIATRGDLFAAEQRNIARALLRRPPPIRLLLTDSYLRRLHRDMFGEVWDWAGRIAADYLVMARGRRRFSWGIHLHVNTEELRAIYRRALQRADAGDIEELVVFARS